jgi:hypothetical protein
MAFYPRRVVPLSMGIVVRSVVPEFSLSLFPRLESKKAASALTIWGPEQSRDYCLSDPHGFCLPFVWEFRFAELPLFPHENMPIVVSWFDDDRLRALNRSRISYLIKLS